VIAGRVRRDTGNHKDEQAMRTIRVAAVAVASLLAIVPQAHVGTAQPARPDPCRLMTLQDVTGVLGGGYQKSALSSKQACAYIKSPGDYAEVWVYSRLQE
jgi:hypothetical protein